MTEFINQLALSGDLAHDLIIIHDIFNDYNALYDSSYREEGLLHNFNKLHVHSEHVVNSSGIQVKQVIIKIFSGGN
jgi:hypothetical protein